MRRHLLSIALLTLSSFGAADVWAANGPQDAGVTPTLWGTVLSSDAWEQYMPERGMYVINTSDGTSTLFQ